MNKLFKYYKVLKKKKNLIEKKINLKKNILKKKEEKNREKIN